MSYRQSRDALQELSQLASRIALEAGAILMQRPSIFEITSKSVALDIATQMDRASETFIVDAILAARPHDGIIGEEGATRSSSSGITWVIDPIDGTVNYLYGLPAWNVSIAAKDEQGSLVGVVHSPTLNSTWKANFAGGAYLNGMPVSCNKSVDMDRALIGTGFAYDIDTRVDQRRIFDRLLPKVRDIRSFGVAATDICFVASGMLDGYFETDLKEWDLAASSLIAQEAGAIFTISPKGRVVCAGPSLHPDLAQAVEEV